MGSAAALMHTKLHLREYCCYVFGFSIFDVIISSDFISIFFNFTQIAVKRKDKSILTFISSHSIIAYQGLLS